jgi:hypothetical protein
MNSALQRQLMNKNISILPILLEDCEVPPLFTDLFWADFRDSFNKGIKHLLKSIKTKKNNSF